MQTINIGILGLGTVGAGTVEVLRRNAEEIGRRANARIEVIAASVRDLAAPRGCDIANIELTTEPMAVVTNPEVDVIVETMGGEGLARELVLAAIEHGKPVVTANKALIAIHGNEIIAAAEKRGVAISFEPAVAGGISIIKSLREGLTANRVNLVAGIINGTGNFILSEMRDKGRPFAEVLNEAQQLGYAEADPTFDVEGIDAAHKLTILASLAYGIPLAFDKVYTEGISDLNLVDVAYAEQLGYRIKHLGIARRVEQGIELRVHPTLIPERRLLANVDGVMNAVLVKGDAVGNTLYYGAGAGAEPTASSVIADLVDIARTMQSGNSVNLPPLGFHSAAIQQLPLREPSQFESAYYLRVEVDDEAGVMSSLASIFATRGISLEGITQKEPARGEKAVSVIFITQRTNEGEINSAIAEIESMAKVHGTVTRIRVEHLH